MTAGNGESETQVGHVADTGVFIWIGGPQPDTPGPSKFDTVGQLATTDGIVFTISRQAYDELTEDTAPDYTTQQSFIDTAIEAGWVEVADPLDFTIGPVPTVLNRAEQLIRQRDTHHQDGDDARADASLLAIATQLIETEQVDQIIIYTTDKAQSETAEDHSPLLCSVSRWRTCDRGVPSPLARVSWKTPELTRRLAINPR